MQHLSISLVPIFNHLQVEEMQEIVATTQTRRYERNEEIYAREIAQLICISFTMVV